MKFSSMRSAIFIASVIVGSVIPSQAFAETPIDVLTGIGDAHLEVSGRVTSTYTFSQSMILNSVGFVDYFDSNTYMAYFIDGIEQTYSNTALAGQDGGVRWLTLSNPTTVLQNSVLTVTTGGRAHDNTNFTNLKQYDNVNSSANVTFSGAKVVGNNTVLGPGIRSNSNIRVSNPGSNVAPEPGTFALALTGGAVLIGICIRRRRNAA